MKTCKNCLEQKREEMFHRRCSTCKECKKLGDKLIVVPSRSTYFGYQPYMPREKKVTVPSDINILKYL